MGSLAAGEHEPLILALWERGAGLARWAREEALLAGDAPSRLGARNVALLRLRAHLFGRAWPLRSTCPACASDSEFVVDCATLADELSEDHSAASTHVDYAGRAITLRAAMADDLRAIATLPDADTATRALLARCVTDDEPLDTFDADTLAHLSDRLESLDPAAVVSFALACPCCRHDWSAVIDVGEAVWAELQRAAECALIEVDALARAYGWTECEVFRLSPVRRAAYLQLVGAP